MAVRYTDDEAVSTQVVYAALTDQMPEAKIGLDAIPDKAKRDRLARFLYFVFTAQEQRIAKLERDARSMADLERAVHEE